LAISGLQDDRSADALWSFAGRLADAAAASILPHFRAPSLAVDNKAKGREFDPVTRADAAGERAMRDLIDAERPQDGILGEEEGSRAGTSGLTWVLDPIDGTRAFMSGLPTWGTLISVDDGTGPILGLIDQPHIGERFVGGLGQAEMRRGSATTLLKTRETADLGHATLFTTFPEIGSEAERLSFERVRDRVRLTRYGCDCYAYALLALGQIDLVIEAGLNAYDIQAPIAVIQAAGGIVTNWEGNSVHQGGRAVAAANPAIHAAALNLLAS